MATVDRKEDLEKRLAQLHTERDEAEKMLRSKLSSDDRQRYLAEMERLEKEISQNEMELRQIRGTPSNGAAGIPIIGGMQLSKPLSPSSHQAFEVALAIGQQVGQSLLVSETLLIGLNYKADGPTRAVLTAFGWPPDKFFQWLHHRQGWSLSVESLERASTSTTSLDLSQQSISTNIERILDRATQIAEERGANWIRTRYLLTALLDVGLSEENERQQPVAYQWLQEMGIPMGQVRTVLAQVPEKAKVVSSMFAYSASSAFADTAAQQDTLGFEQYAQALAEIIVKPETIPPVVIGIYGPWGSGKSTFLELVKRHLGPIRITRQPGKR